MPENEVFVSYPDEFEIAHAFEEAMNRGPAIDGWVMFMSIADCGNRNGGEFLWFRSRVQLVKFLHAYPLLGASSVESREDQIVHDRIAPSIRQIVAAWDSHTISSKTALKQLNKNLAFMEQQITWLAPVRSLLTSRHRLIQTLRMEFQEICDNHEADMRAESDEDSEEYVEQRNQDDLVAEFLEFVFESWLN